MEDCKLNGQWSKYYKLRRNIVFFQWITTPGMGTKHMVWLTTVKQVREWSNRGKNGLKERFVLNNVLIYYFKFW